MAWALLLHRTARDPYQLGGVVIGNAGVRGQSDRDGNGQQIRSMLPEEAEVQHQDVWSQGEK